DEIIKYITKGVSEAAGIALIVGIARGIQVVLEAGCIMDTIIYALSTPLQNFGPTFGLIFISIITALIHFVIPSGSGLAYAVVPIIGPLGLLIGATPQATVLAFQIGATVPNYLYPTVGATMAELGIAQVPIDKWWKYALKLTLATFVLCWIFIFIATVIGY
ncbi:MAG: AbgT family transporter, partial [Sphaerochaetaceae bacterium]|nr:AbgT family transporter [Sphaerochaetaceae bacterium]